MSLLTLPSDPLEAYSGLALFPRTFASFPNPPPPHHPDNLQHSHDFLKAMPVQSPNKLMQQAKAIVDNNSSELLNLDMSNSYAEIMENPRERRPALGRKRPRFSLKPNSSQPTVKWEPSLDIDKLEDPEEFFVAFERAENAKREIEKQTGTALMDLDQNIQSMFTRPRRPGMLRRSVNYKHRYYTAFSPVESFEEEIRSPICNSRSENSDLNVELQDTELSVANAENKASELLDHLLTSNCDGDDTINLLQERLQIKPVDLENICLPDFQDIRKIDLKASRESLVKPKNLLSDIQSLMKGFK
ncbi:centromere protein C-like [Hibiscus syriacus]|uniref:centromere protein C-like n=1 Tax=Hibiscus syriacus TaxID=106335 RepID=UPI0019239A2F|nr:centromere protein C-like [Hibiscus syriacus]